MKQQILKSKKVFLSMLLSSGILGIVFSCCPDRPFWDISDVERCLVSNYQNNNTRSSSLTSVIRTDSIILNLTYFLEYSLASTTSFNPFITSTYATSCDEYNWGLEGIKDKLTSINVICNSHNASGNVNPSLLMTDFAIIQGQSIPNWLANESFNRRTHQGSYVSDFDIIITKRPTHGNLLDFTIKMNFESGRILTAQSDIFTWRNDNTLGTALEPL